LTFLRLAPTTLINFEQPEKEFSFFVGDAAGRHYKGKRSDFSSTDRKWAHNVGLNFFTPEEYFLGQLVHTNFELPGFHVSSIPELPLITPTSSPLLPTPLKQEVVLFVGYPCLGKTSFYRGHFQIQGYEHINQDSLKTRDRCIKALQSALKGARSCVIDNTNRDVSTRAHYINVANAHKVPIRCILFVGSCELAWHNNLYRAYNLPLTVAAREAVIALHGIYQFSRQLRGAPERRRVCRNQESQLGF
jgi:bifunctional polynucleotide phosphatase/kinase